MRKSVSTHSVNILKPSGARVVEQLPALVENQLEEDFFLR